MKPGFGSLDLTARRSGTRTVLERVRYDGISRCSRAFPQADAALVVLSQLGPGVVRGDSVSLMGRLRAHSHLIVTSQSATRLMGGVQESAALGHWHLEAGALLDVIGEPLIASVDARYTATTTFELEADARMLLSEIAKVPMDAQVRLRTSVRQNGREIFYDAVDAACAAPLVVGTFAVLGIGKAEIAALTAALDACADAVADISIGIGSLPHGAIARVLANDVWTIRSTLDALRSTARFYCTLGPPALAV